MSASTSTSKNALGGARLYGIVDSGYVEPGRIPAVAERMLAAGIDVIQLRGKSLDPATILALARELAPLSRGAGVPLIVNDHPEIAAEAGADGVHVGQDDLSVQEARRLAGRGMLIGKSTHSPAQAIAAFREGADYIGFGPLFATPTKPGRPAIGIETIEEVHRQLPPGFPVFCIGGIKLENLASVVAAGARRVVIVSGILQAADIPLYIREVVAMLPGRAAP